MMRALAWGVGLVLGVASVVVAVLVGAWASLAAAWAKRRMWVAWLLFVVVSAAIGSGIWWWEVYLMRDPAVRRERFLERARESWSCTEAGGIESAGKRFQECVEQKARGFELRYRRERGEVVE